MGNNLLVVVVEVDNVVVRNREIHLEALDTVLV